MNGDGKEYVGYLQVGVFSQTVAAPVPNAKIIITSAQDEEVIVEQLITDLSGQTEYVGLPAPPIALSLDVADYQPYSEYNVIIEAEGFEVTKVSGVQILPNVQARQQVRLLPQRVPGEKIVISIKPHTLWGVFPPKIAEDEIKPLPPGRGEVVLPEPVVPEFIIVHIGVPTDTTAQNLWIPYKDYIKNVACCEIFPTWPEAAIRANVLAIISFTLNRVYTEWYRSRGYSFTITNSTAYDQAFSYGRNIFDEISVIVDEIFTTFITRPGIRQPLFTQYCDGRRTKCPNWMTQWGSKEMADQGYNTMDILKRYYGSDIFLMQAPKVEGAPSSFPGEVLQLGSSGEAVRTIQAQLNSISNNFPAIPKIKEDGIYGEQTLAAVEKFQSIFNMPSSGLVDFGTWYKISSIYVAVARLAEL